MTLRLLSSLVALQLVFFDVAIAGKYGDGWCQVPKGPFTRYSALKCQPGTFCKTEDWDDGKNSCQACESGKYQDETDHNDMTCKTHRSESCGHGFYLTDGSKTTGRTCEDRAKCGPVSATFLNFQKKEKKPRSARLIALLSSSLFLLSFPSQKFGDLQCIISFLFIFFGRTLLIRF